MNTNNIDALATAAAVRADENEQAKATLMRRVSLMSVPKNSDSDNTHHPLNGFPPASTPVSNNDKPSPKSSPSKPSQRSSNGNGHEKVAKVEVPHAVLPKQQHTSLKAPFKPKPKSNRRKPSFAEKLHAILSNKHLSPVISWLSTGKSFCILNKEQFTRHILPFYFREAKFGTTMKDNFSMN